MIRIRFIGIGNMIDEFLGESVVVDLRSRYVCLGTLKKSGTVFLELHDADLHDLRDTETTRELYVAESYATGIKRNRRRVLVAVADVVAISKLADVVDE